MSGPNRSSTRQARRRGLTLIELTLALSITAIVAVAVSAALAAVNAGVNSRRDNRTAIVRAAAAQNRLAAYIGISRCLLATSSNQIVLWLDDSRESESVHASEIRWLQYDSDENLVTVYFVKFPDSWTQTMIELADREYAANTNWDNVFAGYQSQGYMASVIIIDGVDSFNYTLDNSPAVAARHVNFQLGLETDNGAVTMMLGATVRHHQPPQR